MKKIYTLSILAVLLSGCGADFLPIPEPSVRILTPQDGERVASPVFVDMKTENFGLEPPGEARAYAGYLVLILNEGCLPEGAPIPEHDLYLQLDDGSSHITLTTGDEIVKLCLQAADGDRRALEFVHEIQFESFVP